MILYIIELMTFFFRRIQFQRKNIYDKENLTSFMRVLYLKLIVNGENAADIVAILRIEQDKENFMRRAARGK